MTHKCVTEFDWVSGDVSARCTDGDYRESFGFGRWDDAQTAADQHEADPSS